MLLKIHAWYLFDKCLQPLLLKGGLCNWTTTGYFPLSVPSPKITPNYAIFYLYTYIFIPSSLSQGNVKAPSIPFSFREQKCKITFLYLFAERKYECCLRSTYFLQNHHLRFLSYLIFMTCLSYFLLCITSFLHHYNS